MPPVLIETLMPDHDSSVVTTRVWHEPPGPSLQAAADLDLLPNPIMSTLGIIRPAPGTAPQPATEPAPGRMPGPGRRRPRPVSFTDLLLPPLNWVLLAQDPGHEIVAGQIRPVRQGAPGPDPEWSSMADFRDFSVPGYAKVAISLRAHPCGTASSILTVETRVTLTDPRSRRQLKRNRLFAGYLRIRHGRRQLPQADDQAPDEAAGTLSLEAGG